MDKQKSTAYTGRFGDSSAAGRGRTGGSYRPQTKSTDQARRPSGFGTAGQTTRSKPAPEPASKKAPKAKPEKEKKEKKIREEREPGKNRPVLRVLLVITAVILVLLVLVVIIFGGEDKTYHQMPTIERESIADFAPEETPLPGVEGL